MRIHPRQTLSICTLLIASIITGCTGEGAHDVALLISPASSDKAVSFTDDELNSSSALRLLRVGLENAKRGQETTKATSEELNAINAAIDERWRTKYGGPPTSRIVEYRAETFQVLGVSE